MEEDPPLKEREIKTERLEHNEDNLNDSALYISSNWSTGAGGCENFTEFFEEIDVNNPLKVNTFEYNEKVKTHHEQLLTSIPIPELKVQAAIDLPDSEDEEVSESEEDDSRAFNDEKSPFSHFAAV